jgi:hypothetical protein
MNDLEDRLRESLHQLADTVPASPHARAGLDRRLAGRSGRRPLLVIAAAAVVIAAVAVPLAMSGDGEPGTERVATAPPVPSPSETGDATLPGDLIPPVKLATFGDHGAILSVRSKAAGEVVGEVVGEEICVAESVPGGQQPPAATCEPVPIWQTAPQGAGLVLTRTVLGEGRPGSGPLPHLLLFVTARQSPSTRSPRLLAPGSFSPTSVA